MKKGRNDQSADLMHNLFLNLFNRLKGELCLYKNGLIRTYKVLMFCISSYSTYLL